MVSMGMGQFTHVNIVYDGEVIGRIDVTDEERQANGLMRKRAEYIGQVVTPNMDTQHVNFQFRDSNNSLVKEAPFWLIHHALVVIPSYEELFT